MNILQKIFSKAIPARVVVMNNNVSEPVKFNQLSFGQLEALYDALSDVRIVEDFISDNIAKIPVKIQDEKGKEVRFSDLRQITEETNGSQSWPEFVKEAVILYGLTGNSFIYRNPESGYLYTLPTSRTTVQLMFDKALPEFLNSVGGYKMTTSGKEYLLPFNEVLHLKNASLAVDNGLWALGSSPYFAGTPNIETLEANYESRVGMIRDRGALGMIVNKNGQFADPEESKRVKEELLEKFGITEGKDKFVVTNQDLDFKQIALGLAELQLIENLEVDFSYICKLRGLDPAIFSSEGSTYSNQEQARKAAIKNVIVPIADKFYNKLNEFLRQYYKGQRLVPQYDQLPEYGEVNTELSKKLIGEVKAGILNERQAFEQLYPDGKFEGKEKQPIQQPAGDPGNAEQENNDNSTENGTNSNN